MQSASGRREEVAEALERVLGRDQEPPPSLLERLGDWLDSRVSFGGEDILGRVLLWGFLAVLLYFLVRFLVRLNRDAWFGGSRLDLEDEENALPVAVRVARLRGEARRARSQGELRLALRKLLYALVLGLGGKGNLEFRAAWTYRELLRRGKPSPAVGRLLGPLVDDLEAKEFGRQPVVESDLERLEELCRRHLGPLPNEDAA